MPARKPVNSPPLRFGLSNSPCGGFIKTLLIAAILSATACSVSAYESGSLTLSDSEFPEDYISDLYWNLENFRDLTDWVGEKAIVGNNHQTLFVTDSAEGFTGGNTGSLTVEAYSLATLRNSNRLNISIADVTRGYKTTWVNAPVRGDNKPTELSPQLPEPHDSRLRSNRILIITTEKT